MPLNNLRVVQTFHTGNTNFIKIDKGGTIESGETQEELVKDALVFFDSTVKKYFPHADEFAIITAVFVNEEQVYFNEPKEEELSLEQQIRSCTSAAVLKAVYEKIVKGKPEEKVYKEIFKKLSKK